MSDNYLWISAQKNKIHKVKGNGERCRTGLCWSPNISPAFNKSKHTAVCVFGCPNLEPATDSWAAKMSNELLWRLQRHKCLGSPPINHVVMAEWPDRSHCSLRGVWCPAGLWMNRRLVWSDETNFPEQISVPCALKLGHGTSFYQRYQSNTVVEGSIYGIISFSSKCQKPPHKTPDLKALSVWSKIQSEVAVHTWS